MANKGVEAYTTDRDIIDAVHDADERYPVDDLSDAQMREVIDRIEGYKGTLGVRALAHRLIEEASSFALETDDVTDEFRVELDGIIRKMADETEELGLQESTDEY